MNKVYRTVWNEHTNTWVAVQETAKARGKSGKSGSIVSELGIGGTRFMMTAASAAVLMMSGQAYAANGGQNALPGANGNYCYYDTASQSVICGDATTESTGNNTTALGIGAKAATDSAIAIGNGAQANTKDHAIAIGTKSLSSGTSSVALGTSTQSSHQSTVAVGNYAKATNENAVAIGDSSQAAGTGNIAIGQAAGRVTAGTAQTAIGNNTVNLGVLAGADSRNNQGQVAVGWQAGRNSSGAFNVASGYQAGQYIVGTANVAIGNEAGQGKDGAPVNLNQTVAIGNKAATNTNHTVSIGNQAKVLGSTPLSGSTVLHGVSGIAIGNSSEVNNRNYGIAIGDNAFVGTYADTKAINGKSHVDANRDDKSDDAGRPGVAIGWKTQSTGDDSIALGNDSIATGRSSVALGKAAYAEDTDAIAIGNSARAGQLVGTKGSTSNHNSTAIGSYAQAVNGWNTALGTRSYADASGALAVGTLASAEGQRATAIGSYSFAEGLTSTALGYHAIATSKASAGTALGTGTVIDGNLSGGWSAAPHGNPATFDAGKRSYIGGVGNYAIGNENVVGDQTTNSVALGNQIKLGASAATLASTNPGGLGNSIAPREESVSYTDSRKLDSAVAVGNQASVLRDGGIAVGQQSQAGGTTGGAIAIGSVYDGPNEREPGKPNVVEHTKAWANNAIAIGTGAEAGLDKDDDKNPASGKTGAIAIGTRALAYEVSAAALGENAGAFGVNSVALGANSTAENVSGVAVGDKAASKGDNTVAVGANAVADGTSAVAVGDKANTHKTAEQSVALGNLATINDGAVKGVAIGYKAEAAANIEGAVALGAHSVADRNKLAAAATASSAPNLANNEVYVLGIAGAADQAAVAATAAKTLSAVSVGNTATGETRQIINVAAGTNDSDAVNVAQLKAVANQITAAGGAGGDTHFYSVNSGARGTGSNYNNDGATGTDALAAGMKASASGVRSTAVGSDVIAAGTESLAVGNNVIAGALKPKANSGDPDEVDPAVNVTGATAVGNNTRATAVGAQAFGQSSVASGMNSAAIGRYAQATADRASAFGVGNTASGESSFAGGDRSVASGLRSTAVGLQAQAQASDTVVIGSNASADAKAESAVVIGSKASVGNAPTGQNSKDAVAIGYSAHARTASTIALGSNAKADGNSQATAIGYQSNAQGYQSIAFGSDASAAQTAGGSIAFGRESKTMAGAGNAVAIGNKSEAHVSDSLALGSGAQTLKSATGAPSGSIAIGRGAQTTDRGYAMGINARATNEAIAIGTNANYDTATNGAKTIGLSSVAVGNNTNAAGENTVALGNQSVATGSKATALGFDTQAQGQSSVVIGDSARNQRNTGNSSYPHADQVVAVGVSSSVNSLGGIAIGSTTQTTGVYGTAIGIGSQNNADFGVALGALSTTDNTITVNRDGYDPLNPTAPADAAILATKANAAGISVGGKVLSTQGSAPGQTAVRPNGVNDGDIIRRQIHNVAAGTEDTDAVNVAQLKAIASKTATTPLTVGNTGAVDVPAPADAGKLATAGDIANAINNSGFTLTAAGQNGSLVNPGETVDLKNTDGNIVVSKSAGDNNVNFDLAPVVKIGPSAGGNPITINGNTGIISGLKDGVNDDDAVNVGQLKQSINTVTNGVTQALTTLNDKIEQPLTFTADAPLSPALPNGVERKLGETLNIVGKTSSGTPAPDANDFSEDNIGVFAAGNNLVVRLAKDVDLGATGSVKMGDTAVDNDGLTINNGPSITKAGVDAGSKVISNVANGVAPNDAVNVSQLEAAAAAAKTTVTSADKSVTVSPNAANNAYDLSVNTDGATIVKDPATGALKANTASFINRPAGLLGAGKVDLAVGDEGKLATAGDIADAINKSGFTLSAEGQNGSVVNPGETVDLKNTDGNILVSKAAGDNNVNFDLAPIVKIGSTAPGSNQITIDGTAGSISGLSSNLPVTTSSAPNPTTAQAAPAAPAIGNAATVGDVLNAGWNLQTNGAATDFVRPYDTVNFAGGKGTTISSTTDGATTTITVDVNAQGLAENAQLPVVYTDAAGNKVYLVDDPANPGTKVFKPNADGTGATVPANQVIASMQSPDGKTVNAPTKLANVAPGVNATDAVNVSQLKGAADALGGGAEIDPTTGQFKAPSYVINKTDGTQYAPATNVGDALSNLNAEVVKPITFGGDTGTAFDRTLGSTVNVKGGATGALTNNNIGVEASNGTLNVKLAENIDLGASGSVKMGDTTVNNDGLTIAGGPSVTKTGIDAGGKQITNVASGGNTDSNAANIGDVKRLAAAADTSASVSAGSAAVTVTPGATTNGVTDYAVDLSQATKDSLAKADTAVQNVVGDGNVIANKAGDTVSLSLAPVVTVGPSTGGNPVTINGNAGTVGGLSNTTFDPTNFTSGQAATEDQLAQVAQAAGSRNTVSAGSNITVTGTPNANGSTNYQVATNPDMVLTSVTTKDAAGNQTVTNGNGVTITPAAAGSQPVSLTDKGLDNGGNKITNVAAGTAGTDAVNVDQLNQAINNVNVTIPGQLNSRLNGIEGRLNKVENTANAGVAQAIATAGLPQAYLPGKSMVAVGGGYYKGETGYAVGFSTISDGGNWIIKGTASGNSRGHFGASVGAGYQW